MATATMGKIKPDALDDEADVVCKHKTIKQVYAVEKEHDERVSERGALASELVAAASNGWREKAYIHTSV